MRFDLDGSGRRAFGLCAIVVTMLAPGGCQKGVALPPERKQEALVYPVAERGDVVDDYHGTSVADPYRWLEDTDSPQTTAWIEAENKLTFDYLEKIPQREKLRARLSELWNYERFGVPWQRGGRYFFTHQEGLQPQPVLYWSTSASDVGKVLVDPNPLAADGTVAFSGWVPSPDGKLVAYGLAEGGSDWQAWRVRDVETGKDTDDKLDLIKFSSVAWLPDSSGFYYSRYPEPAKDASLLEANYFQKLCFHKLGTPQADDVLVYERPDQKDWGFSPTVTDDGRFLVVSIWRGSADKNLIFYRRLDREGAPFVELVKEFENQYEFLDNDGDRLWFSTDAEAPLGKIVACDVESDAEPKWSDLIPESKEPLVSAGVIGERFVLGYLRDAASRVVFYEFDGKPSGVELTGGYESIGGFSGKRGDKEAFYSTTGFATPPEVFRFDPATGASTLLRKPKVAFDPADYETRRVFGQSPDGTRVPIFLVSKAGLKANGRLPTYLYAYGGFNVPITPSFSVQNLVWMEQGGLVAVANLRGGGEYGRAWHEAGMLHSKQKVFDDFAAAARYLVEHNYTSPPRLAISGRSNGGLLVGASITQHPELFGAAIAGVGVMDMLRFHQFTIGWAWTAEYGSSNDAEQFATLSKYSPLHNIRPGTSYPATLVITADHDDRVVPGHSFKFAAALQAAQAGPEPILIRVETLAGHGAGMPTEKRIGEAADVLAFLMHVMDVP